MKNKFIPNEEEIKAFKERSDESLRAAKVDLGEEFLRGAVSDSYYACFYIIKAVLLAGAIITKTHAGTLSEFNKLYIKNGPLDKKYGKFLADLLKDRINATYDARKDFTVKEAEKTLELAGEFVAEVKKVLKT